MRVAWWITKAICAQALVAFPQQQWLRERALVSRYTYFDSLVKLPLPEGQAGEAWESFNKWCIIRSYKSVSLLSCCSLSSLYVCLLQLNGLGMWHLWGRVEIHTGHWWGWLKQRKRPFERQRYRQNNIEFDFKDRIAWTDSFRSG